MSMTTEPRSAPTMMLRPLSNGPSSASSPCSTPPDSTRPWRRQQCSTPPDPTPDSFRSLRLRDHRGRGTAPPQARKASKAATLWWWIAMTRKAGRAWPSRA